ncbi:MAG: hypothetical protein WC848_02485 [Parcubacteria group bacterium]|jgi:hypothetical protein
MKIKNTIKEFSNKIGIIFLVIFLVAIAITSITNISKDKPSVLPTVIQKNNPERLKQRFQKMTELETKKEYEKIYDSYLSAESKKKVKRGMFIEPPKNTIVGNKEVLYKKWEINDVVIKGNTGYVDNTIAYCFNESCDDRSESKVYSDFVYENDNWFDNGWSHILKPVMCLRDSGYDIPEEFKRSISLIVQRLEQSGSASAKNNAEDIKKISNCLNIQYADSVQEMNEAEGYFIFLPSQSLGDYTIKISPKYSTKDDLLTAILLSHEIQHAVDFVYGNYSGAGRDCFDLEARAFTMQNNIISAMNKEEINSLVTRAAVGNSTEATQIVDLYIIIPKLKGKDYHEKALNFVKSEPFYHEQCKK